MSTPTDTPTPRAHRVVAEEACLHLWLADGERLIPWSACSDVLAEADPAGRVNLHLTPSGCGIQWPDLDEYLSVTRLTISSAA